MAGDVLLGIVMGAQGLKGEVRVKSFSEIPERLSAYRNLRTPEGRVLEIVSSRHSKGDVLVVRFRGIEDRAAAEALGRSELFVARDALPATEEDEFYHADLIGLAAHDGEGRTLGEIRAIHNHGAGDVIEIARSEGGTLLLPFSKEFVPQIDFARRCVVVSEPDDSDAEEQRGVG